MSTALTQLLSIFGSLILEDFLIDAPQYSRGKISRGKNVKVNDILNQTRNLTHTVTANYEEDSYRLVMGRYILFGVKWNFGKMNAVHSARAQQAAMDMVF